MRRTLPAPAKGPEGARSTFEEMVEAFPDYHVEPVEFMDVGDAVLARIIVTGTGRTSGVKTTAEVTALWELREGIPIRAREFASRDDALEAAGLPKRGGREPQSGG